MTKWHNELPNIKPYYAVKSLPLENILKHLSASNVNFDCASRGEIESVLKYSSPQNIVYANPSKSMDDIQYANNNNVDNMVVDSLEEIKKMDYINPNIKKIGQFLKDGTFVKEWAGIVIASKELSIFSQNISECCLGKRKSAGGYIWKFLELTNK